MMLKQNKGGGGVYEETAWGGRQRSVCSTYQCIVHKGNYQQFTISELIFFFILQVVGKSVCGEGGIIYILHHKKIKNKK